MQKNISFTKSDITIMNVQGRAMVDISRLMFTRGYDLSQTSPRCTCAIWVVTYI